MKKVVIYARVSTGDQNCDRQITDLLAFAQRANFEVIKIFKETASGAKDSRPVRKEVMELARKRFIQSILVTELSRWGRSTLDLINTLQELETYNVSINALNGTQFDLTNAHGRLFATMLASFSQFERELIQERIKSGMASAKTRGKSIGRTKGDFFKTRNIALKVSEDLKKGLSIRKTAAKYKVNKSTIVTITKRLKEGLYDESSEKID